MYPTYYVPGISISLAFAFDLLTLNVEHTVKTKVLGLHRQWCCFRRWVFGLRILFFHCLYWHTHTHTSIYVVGRIGHLSAPLLPIADGGFYAPPGWHNHHTGNHLSGIAHTNSKCVHVWYRARQRNIPLLPWLRARFAPDSRLVLLGGNFQAMRGDLTIVCLSTQEFVFGTHLRPIVHGMHGPTSVSAHGLLGVLDIFLGGNISQCGDGHGGKVDVLSMGPLSGASQALDVASFAYTQQHSRTSSFQVGDWCLRTATSNFYRGM